MMEPIEVLIERSSLGSPTARHYRAAASPSTQRAVLDHLSVALPIRDLDIVPVATIVSVSMDVDWRAL